MCTTTVLGLCRSFEELRGDLVQQAQWRAGLDKLPTSTCIAILHIDAAPLKDSLMPASQQAIEQVQTRSHQRHSDRQHSENDFKAILSLPRWQQCETMESVRKLLCCVGQSRNPGPAS